MEPPYERLCIKLVKISIKDYYRGERRIKVNRYPGKTYFESIDFFSSDLFKAILMYFGMDPEFAKKLIFGHKIIKFRRSTK